MSKLIFKCSNCSNIRTVEDEYIGERMIVPRNVLCDECKEKAND